MQTKHWRPGDLSMQSGDTSKGPEESGTFLTCTRKHQKAPDYVESKETILTIFGCFHIWRNKAPTTNLSKLQRFGDIINSAAPAPIRILWINQDQNCHFRSQKPSIPNSSFLTRLGMISTIISAIRMFLRSFPIV